MKIETSRELAKYFISELIASALGFCLLLLIWPGTQLTNFLLDTAGDWLTVMSQVLFPAAIAIWLTFVNVTSGSFGDYLRRFGHGRLLSFSFVFPVALFALTSIWLILAKGVKSEFFALSALFFLSYSGVTFIALVSNLTTVIRLLGEFREALQKRGRGDLAEN